MDRPRSTAAGPVMPGGSAGSAVASAGASASEEHHRQRQHHRSQQPGQRALTAAQPGTLRIAPRRDVSGRALHRAEVSASRGAPAVSPRGLIALSG